MQKTEESNNLRNSKIFTTDFHNSLELLGKNALMGYWEWSVDNSSYYLSARMFSLYGYDKRQPKDLLLTDLFHERLHSEDLPAVEQAIRDTINLQQPFHNIHRVIFDTGEIRYIKAIASVLTDDSGAVTTLFGTAQDVTETYKLEQEQESLKQFYEKVINNSSIALVVIDHQGTILNISKKLLEILQGESAHYIRKKIQILFSEENKKNNLLQTCLQEEWSSLQKNVLKQQVCLCSLGDTKMNVDLQVERIVVGEQIFFVGNFFDISDKIKSFEVFMGTVKHNINNPLSIAFSYVESLLTSKRLNEEIEVETLEKLEKSLGRIELIVRKLGELDEFKEIFYAGKEKILEIK